MTKVTSRWVVNNLTATLKHHLMYNCSVCKYGTLLYRPQVDLRPALAQALWRSQNIGTQSTNENYTSSSTKLYNVTSDTELLRELNTKCFGCRKNGADFSIGCECRNCDNYAQEEERKGY